MRSHVSNNVQMFFMFTDFQILSSEEKDNESQWTIVWEREGDGESAHWSLPEQVQSSKLIHHSCVNYCDF